MTLEQEIKEIVADNLRIPLEDIKKDSDLASLGADSLDGVEIVMALEEKYGMVISDNDYEKIKTIKDIMDYVSMNSSSIHKDKLVLTQAYNRGEIW